MLLNKVFIDCKSEIDDIVDAITEDGDIVKRISIFYGNIEV
ncbi:hypothetical protein [Clostridium sporogenes]|nr:hypothetical protein [Clostridium sporogenes]